MMLSIHQFRRYASCVAKLTKESYPNIKRGKFSYLTDKHISHFERLLGKERVIMDPFELISFNQDWMRIVRGCSSIVLKPKSTEEVSFILQYCCQENLAVCPQGGNTGLVGGSVPVFDEVILSTSLLNKIINIDSVSGILTCEAGCVLQSLENELEKHDLTMPIDLGAKGSCQIGGNISTNAGGLRLIRYGSLLANTRGLEMVKYDGTIINCMNGGYPNKTGCYLPKVVIGSEGTLAVITAAVIQVPPRPKSINLVFLGLKSFIDVLKVFSRASEKLSDILSSCEIMDSVCMENVVEKLGLKCPIANCNFYMIVETHGSVCKNDEEKMNEFLEKLFADNLIHDGILASTLSLNLALWQLRERITEALLKDNYVYKYDISLPMSKFYSVVDLIRMRLKGTRVISVSGFGHIGDGNIHLNIQSKEFDGEILDRIEPFLFEWIASNRGSISAEHGIGFKKAQYLPYAKSAAAIAVMRKIKEAMDPKGILNPYKVFPQLL